MLSSRTRRGPTTASIPTTDSARTKRQLRARGQPSPAQDNHPIVHSQWTPPPPKPSAAKRTTRTRGATRAPSPPPPRELFEAVVIEVPRRAATTSSMPDYNLIEDPPQELGGAIHKESQSIVLSTWTSSSHPTSKHTTPTRSLTPPVDSFSSRLSLSPPPPPSPPMFLMDDEQEDSNSDAPWSHLPADPFLQDAFPDHTATAGRQHHSDLSLKDLELNDPRDPFVVNDPWGPVEKLQPTTEYGLVRTDRLENSSADVMMEQANDEQDDDEDDDPFGFNKVERRLKKTKSLRPKLLAMNERNRRISSLHTVSDRVESNHMWASRRRGGVKGKEKAREWQPPVEIDPVMEWIPDVGSSTRASAFRPEIEDTRIQEDDGNELGSGQVELVEAHDSEVDSNGASSPGTPRTLQKKKKTMARNHRMSIGLDEPPIVLERTPQKKPEAGLPSALVIPMSQNSSRRSKKHVPTTEFLAELLPRRKKQKKAVEVGGMGRLSRGMNVKGGGFEDDSEVGEEGEEEEEEEEEVLIRRRGSSRALIDSSKRSGSAAGSGSTTAGSKANSSRGPSSATYKSSFSRSGKVQVLETDTKNSSSSNSSREKEGSGWSALQREAQKERIQFFKEVDDYELEVETTR